MAVGYEAARIAAANHPDNACRWNGGPGAHFEAWTLSLNRAGGPRFWASYAIESFGSAESRARASLMAAVFHRSKPERNLGVLRTIDAGEFDFEGGERFRVKVGDSELGSSHAFGRVQSGVHSISWKVSFSPQQTTRHHVSPAARVLTRCPVMICSPNIDARFGGRIQIDGREFTLRDEPGSQTHVSGRRRADEWLRVHSNSFEGNGQTVFEGLSARRRRSRFSLPALQSLYFSHRGEEHRFTRFRFSEHWRLNLGVGYWSFSAFNARVFIEGVAHCRHRDMVQVQYADTDGQPYYSFNSELANLKLRVFRRVRRLSWRHVETIRSLAATHLERGSREVDPSVKNAFGLQTC